MSRVIPITFLGGLFERRLNNEQSCLDRAPRSMDVVRTGATCRRPLLGASVRFRPERPHSAVVNQGGEVGIFPSRRSA